MFLLYSFRQKIGTKELLTLELDNMEKLITALDCPVVFSHNDILFNNIVYNKSENAGKFIYRPTYMNHISCVCGKVNTTFTRVSSCQGGSWCADGIASDAL